MQQYKAVLAALLCSVSPLRAADTVRVLFPQGELFQPLLADPKEGRFSLGLGERKSSLDDFTLAQVNVGERFGLLRSGSSDGRRAGQFGLSGGVFSVFNLDTPSWDLVTTDFIVAFVQQFRRDDWSTRFRFFHQSSHLGDEYVINNHKGRVNLSFEGLEAIVARDIRRFRIYGGGHSLIRRFPKTSKRHAGQAGLEYRGKAWGTGIARPVAGLDFKSWEQHGWEVDASSLLGIQWLASEGRSVTVGVEGHTGHAIAGQFFLTEREDSLIGVVRFSL